MADFSSTIEETLCGFTRGTDTRVTVIKRVTYGQGAGYGWGYASTCHP